MKDLKVKLRVRLIIIKKGKILLSYVKDEDFYFYIGGKIGWGETVRQACGREVMEECKANFKFGKILYIRDYIRPEIGEHSVEIYILGDIDKFREVEGLEDDEFGGNHWQTWVDLDKLEEIDVRPKSLAGHIVRGYRSGFKDDCRYLGKID